MVHPTGRRRPYPTRSLLTRACFGAIAVLVLSCGDSNTVTGPSTRFVVGATGNFLSISDALAAAPPGEVISILPGTYRERVVITKAGMKLRAERAVLDGAGVGGTGIGIHVQAASGTEISGFIVENFERGIVLQDATNTIVTRNEVRNNTNKSASTSPPLAPFVTPYEGIVLFASSSNQILDNLVHGNGHDGVTLGDASNSNLIRGNRILNNGGQTTPGLFG